MKLCICCNKPEYQCEIQYCNDGLSHLFKEEKSCEWDETHNEWKYFKECVRCGIKQSIYISSFEVCSKTKDKKHIWQEAVFVHSGGIINGKQCNSCKLMAGKEIY